MLSLDEKLAIATSFPELQRKDVSLGRINFHYVESDYEKTTVLYHLHPNGNGFVYAEYIPGCTVDAKGLINIRDYSEDELREIIAKSIQSLTRSGSPKVVKTEEVQAVPDEEIWVDEDGNRLSVTFVEDLWYIYAGENLDCAFETYEEVQEYLEEEGFDKQ
ncbi:hypothetical protein A8709_27110 [Paenibacillus pectinilyticus]|uniref:Uncharacterized protein n=1 Tax=Paenibacillus pectinilyticus TaxID=512399 RepID=A0A1C1A1S3_9BACL|nr:hypothetical protein [Paenibacillus pectinilyticus]OCT14476.1 hypothetical protein A8709_27110 [Paenibacillus pectinilyticus]